MKELPVPLQDNGALISCLMVSGQGPSHPPFLSVPNTHTHTHMHTHTHTFSVGRYINIFMTTVIINDRVRPCAHLDEL